jgi:hypothetical protein
LNNLDAKLLKKGGIEESIRVFKWQHWDNLFWKAC